MKILSPAKLNLFLHITGKRTDGYHLLESLFVFTDIKDEIILEESSTMTLFVDGLFKKDIPTDSTNIIMKAANLLKEYKDLNDVGVNITLTKNIPHGAGIGGGSSNAASILIALNKLWKLDLTIDELNSLAIKLGADVPVCLIGKKSLVSGIGEKIIPVNINLEKYFVVLASCGTHISTKDVFAKYSLSFKNKISSNIDYKNINLIDFLKNKSNDLLDSAILIDSRITDVIKLFNEQQSCLFANMSGSGSVCFGLFDNKAEAKKCLAKFQESKLIKWSALSRIY